MADLPKLRAPSHARLVDDVCQSLEDAILKGTIKPGERLVETWLTEQLGVSRTTVREALLMLERQGLVVSTPRRGTFVTRLSPQDALDVGCSRALLEAFAVRTGYHLLSESVFQQLDRTVDAMRGCELPGDIPRLVHLDTDFHRTIVSACASRRIVELWESLSGQIRALYLTTLEAESITIEYIAEFHTSVVRALRSGDAAIAQAAIIHHYVREPVPTDPTDALSAVVDQLAPRVLRAAAHAPRVAANVPE